MRRETVQPATAENAPAATPTVRQAEIMRGFAVGMVLLIVVTMCGAGVVALRGNHQRALSEMMHAAPGVLESAIRYVERARPTTAGELEPIGDEVARFPFVQSCEIELKIGGADTPPVQFASPRRGAAAYSLQGPVTGADGAPFGRIALQFAPTTGAWLTTGMLTQFGIVAVAGLLAFWSLYLRARRQLRPLEQVQENLLAYHEGVEPALDLLGVQDKYGAVAEAWNTFVDGVGELRRELERYRCREALVNVQMHEASAPVGVLDRLPLGVVRLDDRDSVTYANAAAEALLDLQPGAPGTKLASRLRDAALAPQLLALRTASAGKSVDLRLTRADTVTVVRVAPIRNAGMADELMLMLQDVSQVVEAERARDEFLAHITHELRTPLTNIRAYTETLSEDFLDDENARRECYNVIMAETRRLSKLIEDVLSVSQIEAGGSRMARARVRVDEQLRQIAQEMQASAAAKSIALSLKIPSKSPAVLGDRHRLHQVWTNLVGNAIKYTPEGREVTIELEGDVERLRVRVVDTGIGIAPEHHAKIFDKFYRVSDPAVHETEGTGLGLAITREILRMHGGNIRVESEIGKGSAFIVELPAVSAEEIQTGAR